jgi:hypothetical protein
VTPDSDRNASTAGGESTAEQGTIEVKIKVEKVIFLNEAKEHRKYGGRVLLARQAPNGMMKLGGGDTPIHPFLTFKWRGKNARFEAIGIRYAMCYNDSWNTFGPKDAGQTIVACVLYWLHPFSLFMKRAIKRTVLVWEYRCEWQSIDPDREIETKSAAYSLNPRAKSTWSGTLPGEWCEEVEYWRN